MRYLLFCLIMAGLFLNCDGRRGKLQKFRHDSQNLSHYFNPKSSDVYIPSETVEIKTDTIIEKKFYVSIRNYSVEKDPILITSSKPSYSKTYQFHKRFQSEIAVRYENREIYKNQLHLEDFMEKSTAAFWREATFEHVWVNEEASNKDRLSITVSILNPSINTNRLYEMSLLPDGSKHIRLLEKNV